MKRSILSLISLVLCSGIAAAGEGWLASEAVTTLTFRDGSMAPMALEIGEVRSTVPAPERHHLDVDRHRPGLSFDAPVPFSLGFDAPGGHFESFTSGRLRHQGGFELRWSDGALSLGDFEIRPGAEPRTLVLADPASGSVVFEADHLHVKLDPGSGRLWVFNADLRVGPGLARAMGDDRYAGVAVGSLALSARAKAPDGYRATRGSCPDNWVGDVDVQLIDMSSLGQAARGGGQVVVVPSARLKNVGTADVPWYDGFSGTFPPYDNDQHPFLVWSMYRIEEGIHGQSQFHQIGTSQVKHAFLTINQNCTGCGSDFHILGLGCEDVYGQGTNTSLSSLAPRDEITAATGVWAHCDEPAPGTVSHFDQDGDCAQDHFGQGEDDFTHGMVVSETDLSSADPGVTYLAASWYVVRDDVDIFNTMGWRTTAPDFTGSGWLFPVGTEFANGSPLDAWVDPESLGPGELSAVEATSVGHLQVATKVTDLGGGAQRYEYVVMNHDFDPQVAAFEVPVASLLAVSDLEFRDLDLEAGNDWKAVHSAGTVSWEMPEALAEPNGIDWGEAFNFGFTVQAPPGPSTSSLGALEPGPVSAVAVEVLAPVDTGEVFNDDFESGDLTAWSSAS